MVDREASRENRRCYNPPGDLMLTASNTNDDYE